MSFYIGVAILVVVSIIEFNPYRYRNTFKHKQSDNYSGILMTVSSFLVGLASIIDKVWNISPFWGQYEIGLQIGAIVVIIVAFLFRNTALHILGKNFSYAVAPLQDKLRTNGLYKYIRHPAYLGTCLYAIATPLLFSSKIGLIIMPFVIASVIYRISLEESFLMKTVGKEYGDYRQKTWRMIPFIY